MTALAKPAAPGAATVDDRPTRGRRIAVRVLLATATVLAVLATFAVWAGLALVLPVLSLGLFATAVYLARGRRRETLLAAGLGLMAAGALVLVARGLLGGQVVDSLASTEAVRPAASAAWSIGTSILRDVAQAAIVIGIPLVAAACLAGPSRLATAIRRLAAPWLREQPELVYTATAAAVLIVIAWGPIPATQKALPVLVMIAVVITGVEALRRQTAREFPPAAATADEHAPVLGA
jgi:hypothetical protein